MLTKIVGVDFQAVFMTMLGLIALYLLLVHSSAVNTLVKTVLNGADTSLVILQGRSPKSVLK